MISVTKATLLLLPLLGAVSACAERTERVSEAPYEVLGPREPPPLRSEVVLARPGPEEAWVWRRGHWQWDGREFVWVGGHWTERPRPAMVWVPDRWEQRADRWVFIPGYFR